MMNYFNRLSDPNVQDEFNLIVDAVNAIEVTLNNMDTQLSSAKIPTMDQIQANLQQGGSNPLNLTGLQGRQGT